MAYTTLARTRIDATDDRLISCRDARALEAVAVKTALSNGRRANLIDSLRSSGAVGGYTGLPEAPGVDAAGEPGSRCGDGLAAKVRKVDEARKLTRAVPAVSQVEKWIQQTRTLDPLIGH